MNLQISPPEAVIKMYAEHARGYADMMDSEILLPMYDTILSRIHENITELNGPLVDTACGSGHMLEKYHKDFDRKRPLRGIDLAPEMVKISQERLNDTALVEAGDMRSIPHLESASVAGVINFFALHHLDHDDVITCLEEWHRILVMGGFLSCATWEGQGQIDYGDESDLVALRISQTDLVKNAELAGFTIIDCRVEPVADFDMDALYIECRKG